MLYSFEHPEIICCDHCPCGHEEYNHAYEAEFIYCKLAKRELKGQIHEGTDLPNWCPLKKEAPTYKDIISKFAILVEEEDNLLDPDNVLTMEDYYGK